MKKVSKLLQCASNGKERVLFGSIKSNSKISAEENELDHHLKSRSQEKALIAAVNSDIREQIRVPYLVIQGLAVNNSDFSKEIASVLLESSSCILIETDVVSKAGFERLAFLLKNFQDMFDGRLTVILQSTAFLDKSVY